MELSLLGAAVIGVGAMYSVLRWESGRANAADCTRTFWDALLGGVIAGLVVGRVAAMVADGVSPLRHPADALIVRGGVDTGFASLGALVTVVLMLRRVEGDLWWLLDAAAPAAVAGLAGWHGGCLLRDACLGSATGMPWGVAQAGSGIARHPVEIYAGLALTAAAATLILWKRRRPSPGAIAGASLAIAGAVRLATEPLRLAVGGRPVAWYAAAAVGGATLLVWRARRRTTSPPA